VKVIVVLMVGVILRKRVPPFLLTMMPLQVATAVLAIVWSAEPLNVTVSLIALLYVPEKFQSPVSVRAQEVPPSVNWPAPLTLPLTVSTLPLAMERIEPELIVIPAQVRLPLVFTVLPNVVAMMTESVARGATPPTHVPPKFQLPPAAVLVIMPAAV
jgi:hypothetical protein